MAIIIRIVSADGRKTITKELPAMPARLKVPVGAKVEVIDKETDVKMSLAQYINAHSDEAGEDGDGSQGYSGVTVETVQEWGDAIAWLDMVEQQAVMANPTQPSTPASDPWYDPGSTREEGDVFGFDKDTLLIGGLVGAGAVAGAVALSGGNGGDDDTVAPVAPTALDLAADDDTGKSSTDNITTKTTDLTISGTAEAGSKVELFNGTESLGTTIAGANGKFTFDIDLEEGANLITATATDNAGNVSAKSEVLGIGVDLTAPGAPTGLDLTKADDTGISDSDNITKLTSGITITGSAAANSTVELFDGSTSLGTTTAASNGNFTIDVSLTEGKHTLTAVATDLAGNTGAKSAGLDITVDTTLPAAPTGLDLDPTDDNGVSNSDNITSQSSSLTISGKAEAGATVQLISNGNEILGTTVADSNGVFVRDIELGLGVSKISAVAIDAAGNKSPATAETLNITVVQSENAAAALSADFNATLPDTDLLDYNGIGNMIA